MKTEVVDLSLRQNFRHDGLPGGTRTPYPELRRFVLYPDELPADKPQFCQIEGVLQIPGVVGEAVAGVVDPCVTNDDRHLHSDHCP